MNLVLTSYTGIYSFNTSTRQLKPIHQGSGMYYGVTWLNNRMYVVARGTSSDYYLGNEKILIFDKQLKLIGELPYVFKNCGLHSILTIPDRNELWLTAPLKNKIIRVLLNQDGYPLIDYYPDINYNDDNPDYHHYNSLSYYNGSVLLNIHNKGRKASEIWEIDISKTTPLIVGKYQMPGSTHSHCCWKSGGTYWTCASEQGQIKNNRGRVLLPRRLAGYTRGLILTKDRLLVGESQRVKRDKRVSSSGSIYVYERKSMKHLATYHWPRIGQIAEIRSLDVEDEHHWPEPFWKNK